MDSHRLGQLLADGCVYILFRFRYPITQLSLTLIEQQAPTFIRARQCLWIASDFSCLSPIHSVPVSRLVAQCQCSCVPSCCPCQAQGVSHSFL